MEKQEITITVSGIAKSGKSHLVYYLKKFLQENGFDVSLTNDIDYPNEEYFNNQMSENLEKIMESIKDSKTIVISETRQSRAPEAEYQRGIEDGKIIEKHGSTSYIE